MKNTYYLTLFLFFPLSLTASNSDTILVNGVSVISEYSPKNFPEKWRTDPINAKGEPINSLESKRAELIIIKSLKKYPEALLNATLKAVYLVKSISFFNVNFGGTNSTDAVFISSNGESNGYTDIYIEQTFHHEFSSILYRDYPSLIDTLSWKKQNEPGFNYNDPASGVGAIKNNESSQGLNARLAEKGMLTQYAMSSLENDINTLAQNLFRPYPDFWKITDKYPRVGNKVRLLINFYGKLNPIFTEQYFRSFSKALN